MKALEEPRPSDAERFRIALTEIAEIGTTYDYRDKTEAELLKEVVSLAKGVLDA